jgi:predicted nucleic acid-binding protein
LGLPNPLRAHPVADAMAENAERPPMLVDTSVWVDHLNRQNAELTALLETGEAFVHPFVIGELACGNLKNRDEVLGLLQALPQAPVAEHEEVLAFIALHRLMETGLGWVDMHLLASSALLRSQLWSLDRQLAAAARQIRAH